MSQVVQLTAPRLVEVREEAPPELAPGMVKVATWYSGISAGTELTAYRGSNPNLVKTWDADQRLFHRGRPTFGYPVTGWGYEEVGRVVEVAPDVTAPAVGDMVYGIWGHRSEAVIPAGAVAGSVLPAGTDPLQGVFARTGAIALNTVLSCDVHIGEYLAVFGQGVIGLLTTQLVALNGGRVIAVDLFPHRLEMARQLGAETVPADFPEGAADAVRLAAGGRGVDTAIELSGSHAALHEAIRCVGSGGRVVAAGFYQGDAVGLRLGEEFHHNRVEIVASQIGSVPRGLAGRWDHRRLVRVFMDLVNSAAVDVTRLVSHVIDVVDVADAYALLDERPAQALQVVLRFPAAESGA